MIEDYLWKEYCFNKRDNTIHIITILEAYTKISAQLSLIKIIFFLLNTLARALIIKN